MISNVIVQMRCATHIFFGPASFICFSSAIQQPHRPFDTNPRKLLEFSTPAKASCESFCCDFAICIAIGKLFPFELSTFFHFHGNFQRLMDFEYSEGMVSSGRGEFARRVPERRLSISGAIFRENTQGIDHHLLFQPRIARYLSVGE